MAGHVTEQVSIAIDMKKHLIRIHKPTLHLMGDPSLLQLLFEPEDKVIAIRCPDHEEPNSQTVRIRPYNMRGKNRCDFYSTMLIRKLRKAYGDSLGDYTYRFTGTYIAEQRIAVFPMSTMQRYDPYEVWNNAEKDAP